MCNLNPLGADSPYTINQNYFGLSEDLFPKLNPLGCFRGIAEDCFPQPVYLLFLGDATYPFTDFNELREFIFRHQAFTQIIALKNFLPDTSDPFKEDNRVIISANF